MKRNYYLVIIIFLIFFAISFLTNILGSINPNVSDSFSLTGTMTGLLPFSFFIAYALMSIPSGMIVQKIDEKKSLIFAWILAFCGAVLFSMIPLFPVFLASLFMIGCGMALLQVALFPLLRVTGGEEHFAFNSVIVQLVFGLGSFVSPFVYSYLVTHLGSQHLNNDFFIRFISYLTPEQLPWVSIYWVFALVSFLMLAITLFGNSEMASYCFPALGFCLSVMYAIIFSLALNSISKYHGSFAGILCTAIAGGAIFSLLIGKLKDLIGLKAGMVILFIPLAYILSLSFWAKPLVKNATIKNKKTN